MKNYLSPATFALLLFACTLSLQTFAAEEELWCQRGGKRIYGVLYRPQPNERDNPFATAKYPLVIISHGFGGNHQWGEAYANVLTQQGFLVYCFDFCGGGNHSKSDGKTTEMSVFTEREDLKTVLNRLREMPEVDTSHITLMGESQGGIVTAITAAEVEEMIHDIILFYPAFSIPDDSRRRFPTLQDIPEEGEIWGVKLGKCYAEGFYNYDVYQAIASFQKPVLIIHGDADRIVPISYSNHASQVYNDAEFYILHGIDHGFHGMAQWLATELVTEFLERHKQ